MRYERRTSPGSRPSFAHASLNTSTFPPISVSCSSNVPAKLIVFHVSAMRAANRTITGPSAAMTIFSKIAAKHIAMDKIVQNGGAAEPEKKPTESL